MSGSDKPVPRSEQVSYEGRDLEALGDLPNYYRWIFDLIGPFASGHAIEFGAGIGTASEELRKHVQRLDLVEPSRNLQDELELRFSTDPEVRVFPDTLESHLAAMPSGCRDTVMLINVLEHVEDDRGALRGFRRILKPHGHLLLFVPALQALFGPLDTVFGHFRRYALSELAEKVRAAGFGIVKAHYFDLLGVVPWWLTGKVARSTRISPTLARLYDMVGVPITRALERVAKPPIGKNIVLVAQPDSAQARD